MQKHVNKLLQFKHDPHKYHKTLKTLIGRVNNDIMPPLENDNHDIVTDNTQKADLANNYFVSQTILNTTGLTLPTINDDDRGAVPDLEQIQVTEKQVLKNSKFLECQQVNRS